MIMLSSLLTLVIAVPVVAGFITSRGQRGVDRRHLAAFVGFSAAIVALGATIGGITASIIWLRPPQSPYDHPLEQGFVFIFSIVGLLSTGTAFCAGLCQPNHSDTTKNSQWSLFPVQLEEPCGW